MRTLRLFPLLALLSLLFVTCKNDATEPTLGEGAVSGLITDAITGTVVTGATVTSQGPVATGQYVQSDDGGRFLLKFNLDSTGTLLLSISRQGYRDTSLMVAVLSGSTTPITVRLNRTGGGGAGIASVFGTAHDAGNNNPLAGTQTVPIPVSRILFPGGDTQVISNVEYRIPIIGPVTVAPFMDIGFDAITRASQLQINPAQLNTLNTTLFGCTFDPLGNCTGGQSQVLVPLMLNR